MTASLNMLYEAIGVSKQSLHQRLDREALVQSYEHQLLFLVYQVRQDHPTMGCRDMYYLLQPECIGRDAFELFCKREGLASEKPVNFRRTTNSQGVVRFENLTIGLQVIHLNQLWVSDITYFDVCGKFYYLTFITDAFSRRILGHSVSNRLFTEQTTLPALKMAVRARNGQNLTGTILHSDGGGQYYDKDFIKETSHLQLVNSMCEYPWENGQSERVNGVIKNNYLVHRKITNLVELIKEVDRSVKLYNEKKPHSSLNRVSPLTFENYYIYDGKTSEAGKSSTENETHGPRALLSPSGCGKTSSSKNISMEYESKQSVKVK